MSINGMQGIAQAIQQKNAMGIKSATPSANQSGNPGGLSGGEDLQRIASDSNANATPQKNAADIDIIAMKMLEFQATFELIMPGLDEMKYKVDAIYEALQQASGQGAIQASGQPAAAPQSQPPVSPAQVV
jgi:hypothetical protein